MRKECDKYMLHEINKEAIHTSEEIKVNIYSEWKIWNSVVVSDYSKKHSILY